MQTMFKQFFGEKATADILEVMLEKVGEKRVTTAQLQVPLYSPPSSFSFCLSFSALLEFATGAQMQMQKWKSDHLYPNLGRGVGKKGK